MSAMKRIKTQDGLKEKVEAVILDPFGSFRIDIWGDFIEHILFHKLAC